MATYSGSTTNFLHTDWLGTKRVMSSISGANSQTCTSLPYGDGASCTGTEWGYNHFTDDIHDSESNLEHTWFRQLSGTQGRWTSPDPYLGSMNFSNPQSLNRYNYVFGAPTMQVDPLGLETSYFLVGDCLYSYNLVSNKAEDGEFEVTGPPTLVFCAGGGSSGGSGGGGGGGGKRMTIAQCRAANTLLEREEKSGTTVAAWQSAIGFGDGTVEPFNSSTPGNAYTETAVGSVKVDWFTDLRTTGLIPGPQIPAYIIGKLVWTGVRLATGAPITNSLPFQDPIESRTMALAAGGYGFRNLFTPEFMKENCGTF